MRNLYIKTTSVTILLLCLVTSAQAKGDDFGAVVKLIERFYGVKHEGLSLLERAGIKAVTTVARIKGGSAKRLAEAGSLKLAVFEDQALGTRDFAEFRNSLHAQLADRWALFIQTVSVPGQEQNYIFLRENDSKFDVLLVTIDAHDGAVVQVTLSPANLALLLKDPEGTGKAIFDEATPDDLE